MNNKSKLGFTLVEMMIVIFIVGLTIIVLTIFIVNSYQYYRYNFDQAVAINEARRAVETIVREIREAKYGEDGTYPLVQAGDYTLTFFGDIDADGRVEKVRYFIAGAILKEGVIKPSGDPPVYIPGDEKITTIFNYVRNSVLSAPIFTYYNGDWPADTVNNPLSTFTRLAETKLIHVHMIINVDPNRPPGDFILESDTQIRNLKTNL